jgi:hypothetical protein
MASIRSFFPDNLDRYPHNCFLPIPYPVISVGDLNSVPLHTLAHSFAQARTSLSSAEALSVYKALQTASTDRKTVAVLPINAAAHECLAISNMSIARMVDIDWTGVGGKATICRYKYLIKETVRPSNVVTIAGRTHDGGTVLDVILNRKRIRRLETEVAKLINTRG